MKKLIFSFLVFTTTLSSYTNSEQVKVNRQDFKEQASLEIFLEPIEFTVTGVQYFLKDVYNHELYPKFLSLNFTHLVQFLKYGQIKDMSDFYFKSTFNLFNQKIKYCSFVNAYAFLDLLSRMPDLLAYRFEIENKSFLSQIKDILYDVLISKFNLFKTNPAQCVDELAELIENTANSNAAKRLQVEQLRQVIVRFLEVSLNKLIWSPDDGIEVWISVKKMGEQLTRLSECNIIDELEDLNGLYWSLVLRFCNFIELVGSALPEEVYSEIVKDIQSQTLFFLELDEQEGLLERKSEKLLKVIYEGALKRDAYMQGIVTDFE